MKSAITFLFIIILFIGALYIFASTARYVENRPTPTPRSGENRYVKTTPKITPKTMPTPSGPEPDTFITAGPNEGEKLEVESVTFRFSGNFPDGDPANLRFETKIDGIDANWRSAGSSRTVRLSAGPKTYTFLVRAKTPDGRIDSTPASRTFVSNLSPHYGKISISSLTPYSQQEKITLRNTASDRSPIEISGWRIRSVQEEAIVPQAVEFFNYGVMNPKNSVRLGPSESFVLYTRSGSPGDNLRLNRCVGYLNIYPITPKFPTNCPRLTRWDVRHLSLVCQDYIDALRSCQIPNPNDLRLRDEPDCRQWIQENLNYNGCVRVHQRDIDFYSREWWGWFGINRFLFGKSSDSVRLYDKEGYLVDRYDY